MRGLYDRCVNRGIARGGGDPGIALMIMGDRVHRIENRNVHDCQHAARTRGSELLAEDAILANCHRRVIERIRIERDFIPVAQTLRLIGCRGQGMTGLASV